MPQKILANFYERDIRRLVEEVNLFRDEGNLWKIQGSVKNSCGNLVLHIVGGTNHLIGATLAKTGYKRDREQEFLQTDVDRKELIAALEALIPMINVTLDAFTAERLEADYPFPFDNKVVSNSYVLIQLLVHLNYHLGQVNYLRRVLEGNDSGQ